MQTYGNLVNGNNIVLLHDKGICMMSDCIYEFYGQTI